MKKKVIVFCIALVILLGGCVGVGHYFVGYALSPTSNSEQRNVEGETEVSFDEKSKYEDDIGDEFYKMTSQTSILSQDGLHLVGHYVINEESHLWTILIHGYKSNSQEMMSFAARYYNRHYNVLIPDNRAHGESEGNYIGMGWLDKNDIESWIDWIVNQDHEAQIILHGVSMGGATTMMVSGDNPEHVIGYIEDCGYTSVWDIFSSELKKRFGLSTFPVLDISNLYAQCVAGYNFKEASSLLQVEKCEKPMLFIHGDLDDFVPTEMVYELYDVAQCPKELYVVEGAGHAQSKVKDVQAYWDKVFTFIDNQILNH